MAYKTYMGRPAKTIMSWDKLPVLLSVEQVATLLQISVEAVRKQIRNGRIRATRIDGTQYRVSREWLKAWTTGEPQEEV